MKRYIVLIIFIISSCCVNAQVRIGGNSAPNESAVLDLNPSNYELSQKGLLLPRVELISTITATPMASHVKGMFVFNTATINDVTTGIYYNDGTKWIKLEGHSANEEQTLSITLNKVLDVTSMGIMGRIYTAIPVENIVSITPVFSDNIFMNKYITSSISFFYDNDGYVNWLCDIKNKNINMDEHIILSKIIIRYKGTNTLQANVTDIYKYVGW